MASRAQSDAPAARTIVIADDTAAVRQRFTAALEQAGHHAVAVRSAAELLGRIRGDLSRIDLLVIDLRLSHETGVELVRAVRRIDGGRLPVVVFSGTVGSADEVRGLASLGVVGYINDHAAEPQIAGLIAPYLSPRS